VAAALAVTAVDGSGVREHARPLHAQIQDRPSQVPFSPRSGTSVPPGFEIVRVLGNVYLIAGAGGNVVLQTGDQGIFLVDTGRGETSAALLEAVRTVSDGTIRYIVNTTADPDHYGGNEAVARAGWSPTVPLPGLQGGGVSSPGRSDPRDQYAMVIGHERMLNRLSGVSASGTGAPFALWPTNSFFTPKKTLSFNHEGIELRHEPNAHTDGDVVVFFRKSDVIAAGDLIDTAGYPMFDRARGGTINGLIAGLNDVIDMAIAEFNQQGGTRIVPGHGRVLNETDVADYRDMVTIVRDRVRTAIEQKMTLGQLMALEPTLEYDGLYSRPDWTGAMFVEAIHAELSQAPPAARRP
jgi:glyoxylase-like metal-dependent hydrolase (beta-lactamase superfamily II)